jgi:lipopolysaccharide export system permease protein
MRTLDRYLSADFLATFVITLLVFTFVMSIGAVIKAMDLMARGVSGFLIFKVLLHNIPFLLMFAIPMSVLCAVLLLFSRLSFDGEIAAMKATGISLWQIASPILLWSVILSFLCLYLSSYAAPQGRHARRQVLASASELDPLALLDEGRFVREFPGLLIYVGSKNKREIKDIIVYELGAEGYKHHVRAKSGRIRYGSTNQPPPTPSVPGEKPETWIDLYQVRIEVPDHDHPLDPSKSHFVLAEHYPVKLDLKTLVRKKRKHKKTSDMTLMELVAAIPRIEEAYPEILPRDVERQRTKLIVEVNKRMVLSMSCFAFALIGVPLGIRSRRKESMAGIAVSMVVVFVFYLFIILADNLVDRPYLRPDLIMWVPVLGGEIIGVLLFRRMN